MPTSDVAVYVANADSGDIRVLHLDARSGVLRSVQQVEVGSGAMPLALSPDRRFLYAARRAAPLAAVSFAIDATSGMLTTLGEAPLPHSMAYIATDRAGRYLLSASYGGHQIAVSPIGADGVVQPSQQIVPTEPNAHAIQADRSNQFVFATSLGGGVVMQMRFGAASGRLEPNTVPALRTHAGASPRHFEFSADARFVYVIGELDAMVDVLALDASTGLLSTVQTIATLPPGFSGEPWAADMHLTPDGRFLYVSERRSSTLAALRVDPASGRLTLLGHSPVQAQPRGFAIEPNGRFLIVAGQLSNRVGVHAIDAANGALSMVHEHAVGGGPNWVETLTLPVSNLQGTAS